MGNLNLSYLFIKVEDGNVPGFLAKYYSPDPTAEPQVTRDPKYDSNIVFLGSTGQIFTQGQLYGGNFGTLDSEVSDTGTNVSATVTQTDGKLTSINVTEDYATVTHTHSTDAPATFNVKSGDEGKLVKASDLSYTACYAKDISSTYTSTIVAGGPLADDVSDNWPTDAAWKDDSGNKIIPAGVTMQEFVEKMFLKLKDGTISVNYSTWNPKMSAPTKDMCKWSYTGSVEVGTEVKLTYSTTGIKITDNSCYAYLNANQGYWDGNERKSDSEVKNKILETIDGTTTGSVIMAAKSGDSYFTNNYTFYIGKETKTLVSYVSGVTAHNSGNFTAHTYTSCTNVKTKGSNTASVTPSPYQDIQLTNYTVMSYVTGYWPVYYGGISATSITDDYIKEDVVKKLTKGTSSTEPSEVVIPSGTGTLIVAVPECNKTVIDTLTRSNYSFGTSHYKDINSFNSLNGAHQTRYRVFYVTNAGQTTKEDTIRIILK